MSPTQEQELNSWQWMIRPWRSRQVSEKHVTKSRALRDALVDLATRELEPRWRFRVSSGCFTLAWPEPKASRRSLVILRRAICLKSCFQARVRLIELMFGRVLVKWGTLCDFFSFFFFNSVRCFHVAG